MILPLFAADTGTVCDSKSSLACMQTRVEGSVLTTGLWSLAQLLQNWPKLPPVQAWSCCMLAPVIQQTFCSTVQEAARDQGVQHHVVRQHKYSCDLVYLDLTYFLLLAYCFQLRHSRPDFVI